MLVITAVIILYEVTFLPVREMRVLEGELRLIDPARQLVWSCLTKVNIGSHSLNTRMNIAPLEDGRDCTLVMSRLRSTQE